MFHWALACFIPGAMGCMMYISWDVWDVRYHGKGWGIEQNWTKMTRRRGGEEISSQEDTIKKKKK